MTTMTFDPIGYDFAGRSARTARPTKRLRLTRRGQVVVLFLAGALVAFAVVMLGSSSVAGSDAGTAPVTTTVKVMPGHTLWQIAAEANPDGDIRKTVDDIVRLNSLPDASALRMGSTIAVPVYDE